MSRTFMVPIVLPADPTSALQAATKQYVDAHTHAPGAWQTSISYGSGWAAHASNPPPRYRLEGDTVRIVGTAARSSGTNQTIFTLPSGYRPAAQLIFWTSGGGTTQCRVSVNTDGTVAMTAGSDFTRTSLDGITYPLT